tara:strand:+ start:1267 stop:1410 length:144 start_codon:yes stop_codon:yes gene_type:complete
MGEDKEIRRTIPEFTKRLVESGIKPAEAAKTARECAIRADRRKRENR